MLLQKTLLHIEGLGRQLYPQLDLWATAKPFLEDWFAERYSPKMILEKIQRRAPGWLEQLPQRPELLSGRLETAFGRATPAANRPSPAPVRRHSNRHIWQLAIAVGGVLLLNPQAAEGAGHWHPATWIFLALALHALVSGRRNDD